MKTEPLNKKILLYPSSLAKKLSLHTSRFRDLWVTGFQVKGLEENGDHMAKLFKTLKSGFFPQLEPQEFAHYYAFSLSSILLTASFLADDKNRRRNVNECLRDLLRVFHRHTTDQNGNTSDIILEILKSVEKVNIPSPLEECIIEAIDAFEPGVGMHGDKYYRLLGFYEAFLEAYDKRLKKENGVFFTPYPVVSFIVRSINIILKEQLNRPHGLADLNATILDPAAGTSTFLLTAARLAVDEYSQQNGEDERALKAFAFSHLSNNLYGCEKLLPLCAVSYLNFAHFLEGLGLRLQSDKLLNLFLTNTFDAGNRDSLFRVRTTTPAVPVTVILGNPPYSRHPDNNGSWISEKLRDYHSPEKNLKWLQDDYVKFIRFAQDTIDRSGQGVIGFVTNNAFLESLTFYTMRQSLMKSFSSIYILNLNGNAYRKEKSRNGLKDENIFHIRQGVAISFFIKRKEHENECKVFYADLRGSRKEKLDFLRLNDAGSVPWQRITPQPDHYLFTPSTDAGKTGARPGRYRCCFKVTDIFPVHSVGIVTARDRITIQPSRNRVEQIVKDFDRMDENEIRSVFELEEDSRDWQISKAKEDIRNSGPDPNKIIPILYRPFDLRYTYYTGRTRGFLCMPRPAVMNHMLKRNICLVTVRQVAEGEFNHCFAADTIVDCRVTTSNRGISYVFPLYLYGSSKRDVNIGPAVLERLRDHLGMASHPDPESVFYYVYSVLHSPSYRRDFASSLQLDFPLIPFPSNPKLFNELAGLGEKLVMVHLLKSPKPDRSSIKFKGSKRESVKYVRFIPQSSNSGRILLNDDDCFLEIPSDIWEFRMCGYQVLRKLLNSFRGRTITSDDIVHVSRVLNALRLTIDYQKQIDKLFKFFLATDEHGQARTGQNRGDME
jgi:predicted helicase